NGQGGFPCVRVTTPRASGEVYLHGAHVTSWQPAGAEEVLFLSSKSRWQDGSAIRGGVPICFPWFSNRAEDPHSPAHGLVRAKSWQLEGITHADHDVTIALSTSADASTRKTWPGDFHLLFCVTFGEQLQIGILATRRHHPRRSRRHHRSLHLRRCLHAKNLARRFSSALLRHLWRAASPRTHRHQSRRLLFPFRGGPPLLLPRRQRRIRATPRPERRRLH